MSEDRDYQRAWVDHIKRSKFLYTPSARQPSSSADHILSSPPIAFACTRSDSFELGVPSEEEQGKIEELM